MFWLAVRLAAAAVPSLTQQRLGGCLTLSGIKSEQQKAECYLTESPRSTRTGLILVLPSAGCCFPLNMPSNSEHNAKWNMRTLAEGSEPEQRTDVRSMSHEVNTLRPHKRQQNKGPPKLGRVTFGVLRCLFVLSDAWEGINIGTDEPTAASPERCATGYFEAQKAQNRLVVTQTPDRIWLDCFISRHRSGILVL